MFTTSKVFYFFLILPLLSIDVLSQFFESNASKILLFYLLSSDSFRRKKTRVRKELITTEKVFFLDMKAFLNNIICSHSSKISIENPPFFFCFHRTSIFEEVYLSSNDFEYFFFGTRRFLFFLCFTLFLGTFAIETTFSKFGGF